MDEPQDHVAHQPSEQATEPANDQPGAASTERPAGHVAPLWLTRRRLVQTGGLLATSAGVAGLATACGPWTQHGNDALENLNPAALSPVTHDLAPGVEETPAQIPDPTVLRVLTDHEAKTVDALTSRILPGTPEDPGAHEAGVVTYIDNFLAYNDGLAEWTYREGPWAAIAPGSQASSSGSTSGGVNSQSSSSGTPAAGTPVAGTPAAPGTPAMATAQGGTPAMGTPQSGTPAAAADANAVYVPASDIKRYGYQSQLTPLQVYRTGIAAVDRFANMRYEADFIALSPDQQDTLIGDMANGKAEGFPDEVSGAAFFHNLRLGTSEGMFADPVYGGNRNMVGWLLVGFPGAQRAYQPYEFQRDGTDRKPQSILQMEAEMAGQPMSNDNAIYPVSGTDQHEDEPHHRGATGTT